MSTGSGLQWFAVRCVFSMGDLGDDVHTYEERITLWRAANFEEAIARAESEAAEYAASLGEDPAAYLDVAQCFHLFDAPGDGAEVFSLMRDSRLAPADYLDTFFDSGAERQQISPPRA